jgi:hypothetical protein
MRDCRRRDRRRAAEAGRMTSASAPLILGPAGRTMRHTGSQVPPEAIEFAASANCLDGARRSLQCLPLRYSFSLRFTGGDVAWFRAVSSGLGQIPGCPPRVFPSPWDPRCRLPCNICRCRGRSARPGLARLSVSARLPSSTSRKCGRRTGYEVGAAFGACDGLCPIQEHRHVAHDAVCLLDFPPRVSFPGRGKLDQHAITIDATLLVIRDDLAGLGNRRPDIEGQVASTSVDT